MKKPRYGNAYVPQLYMLLQEVCQTLLKGNFCPYLLSYGLKSLF